MTVKYSIVIPMKDEEGNVKPLINELEPVMRSLNNEWELICVDDGSVDRTLEILNELSSVKPYLKIIAFDSNYGQSSAFDAGFRSALGEFVITLDGDRQNDPSDIPQMIEMAEQFDLVCGVRKKRRDKWLKRAISYWANAVRSRFCGDGVQDTGCSLKIYRKSCLNNIKMYHGMHRFLPALFKIEGFSVGQLTVNHRERDQGKTKYNFLNRSFNTISDMFAVRWMRKRQLNYRTKS